MSTIDLQDAPWIKQAELFGMPEAEEIDYSCPICGEEKPEDFCFNNYGEIIGCNCCCHFRNAYEYTAEKLSEQNFEE